MSADQVSIEQHLNNGLAKHKSGNLEDAISAYQLVLDMVPDHAEAWHLMGLALHHIGDNNRALPALERAVQESPDVPDFKYNLAVVQTDTKNFEDAKRTYEDLIDRGHKSEAILNGYALSLKSIGKLSETEIVLKELLNTFPEFIGGVYNMANLLLSQGRASEALPYFSKALRAQPDNIDVARNMATAHQMLGNTQDGIALLKHALRRHPNDAGALNNLGNMYRQNGDLERAGTTLEQAITADPTLPDASYNLGAILADQNDTDGAIKRFGIATAQHPNFLKARWAAWLCLPQIYASKQHRDDCRETWLKGLKAISAEVIEQGRNRTYLQSAFDAISEITPFALSYQGSDDRAAMQDWGRAVSAVTAYKFPDTKRPDPAQSRSKNRIVFVSAHLREHTIGRLFKNWIAQLDHGSLDVHILSTSGPGDDVTRQISESAAVAHTHQMTATECVNRLADLKADAIIYPDVGMDPKTQVLASLPLARTQLMSWGHPVTSGFETMDFFLSSSEMEPPGGEKHYSETLIKLPGLSVDYDRPAPIRGEVPSHDFLCAQSLFKISPDQDAILAAILKECPQATMSFFAHPIPEVTNAFRERLSGICRSMSLDVDRCLNFIPPCDRNTFMAHLAGSRVILDTFNWSGGNTSLESLAMGRPVVTLPGEFMRGRHTHAMLRMMGIPELIADGSDDYCRIATELFTDTQKNQKTVQQIGMKSEVLFGDKSASLELNQILRDL